MAMCECTGMATARPTSATFLNTECCAKWQAAGNSINVSDKRRRSARGWQQTAQREKRQNEATVCTPTQVEEHMTSKNVWKAGQKLGHLTLSVNTPAGTKPGGEAQRATFRINTFLQ